MKRERYVTLPDGRVVKVLAVRGGYVITTSGTWAPWQLKDAPTPRGG